ncbi:MAG: NAD(P)H-dependent oxidoreductase subunit E [Demequinaceae bacterium]|nr:NAD(P)H-dependent oxidoreductase subunit E [Demequinaceae bacterium]
MLTVPPQLAPEFETLSKEIDALLKTHGRGRDALIPVLQDLRERHNEISDLAMQIVGDRLRVPAVEVQGVATFYSFLGTDATGQHVIHLCRTLSCDMAGAKSIAKTLSKELGIKFGETTEDGQFTLKWSNCIGMCDQAPAALVNREAVGNLTPERVKEIIAGLRAKDAKK